MASRPRAAISLRTATQRRSRSARERRGTSSVLRMLDLWAVVSGSRLQLLQAREIIRDPLFEIVLRLVPELVARACDVIDAGRGIGKAVEVQPTADLHLRV